MLSLESMSSMPISETMWQCVYFTFFLYILSEAIFWVAIKILAKSFEKPKEPAEYGICSIELVRRILCNIEKLNRYEVKHFLEKWFKDQTPLKDICIENYRSFFAWVMFASFHEDLSPTQSDQVDTSLNEMFQKLNIKPQKGFNPTCSHVNMTIGEFSYTHRPLLLYILHGVKKIFEDMSLRALGFQQRRVGKVNYWYRPASDVSGYEVQTSNVYFHGITTGWGGYVELVRQTSDFFKKNRTIFLFDMECIKINSLHFEMPTAEYYSNAVQKVLDRHHVDKVNVFGHSFGTITAGWFIKNYPSYVSHVTLIDPVSLLLAHPETAFNFLYREPSTLIEWCIYLVAAQEITIAYSLRRNFWWYKNILWLEDIPSNIGVHVSLAGNDEVACAHTIRDYAEVCNTSRQTQKESRSDDTVMSIECSLREGQSHAQILICGQSIMELTQHLERQQPKGVAVKKLV